MTFSNSDYWAIFIAAVAGNIIGAIWYWLLATPWAQANGLKARDPAEAASVEADVGHVTPLAPYLVAVLGQTVMAATLAGIIGHIGRGHTVSNGLISGAFCWVGFIATSLTVNAAFARRPAVLIAIDGGYWLIVLMVMGAIIGGLS